MEYLNVCVDRIQTSARIRNESLIVRLNVEADEAGTR